MEAWFRRKYNLPPTDPRFLAATLEDIEADFWMHHYAEAGVTEEYETDGFDATAEAARIEAEEEARAAAKATRTAGLAGGAAEGGAPPAPDDWEPIA